MRTIDYINIINEAFKKGAYEMADALHPLKKTIDMAIGNFSGFWMGVDWDAKGAKAAEIRLRKQDKKRRNEQRYIRHYFITHGKHGSKKPHNS